MSILVIAAHPDDEILGCGGTIAKYAETGTEIDLLILGEGITARDRVRDTGKRKKDLENLKKFSKKAARILGIRKLFSLDFPDNRFDTVPFLDIVKVVEEYLYKLTPDTIYTHHAGDLNIDHRIAFQAVLTATRPLQDCPVKTIYSFAIPSSTEWSFQRFGSSFRPNVFEDITGSLEIKLKAMEAYESEIRKPPHPRSAESIRAAALNWGITAGKKYVEPFELIRHIAD